MILPSDIFMRRRSINIQIILIFHSWTFNFDLTQYVDCIIDAKVDVQREKSLYEEK